MDFLSSTTMSPWLTATAEGHHIPTLITAFRQGIAEVLASRKYGQPGDDSIMGTTIAIAITLLEVG